MPTASAPQADEASEAKMRPNDEDGDPGTEGPGL
jgi:hypothetical protein